ncbi:MAG: hypothetical protein ABEJ43_10010 [Haloferacaceae archaeon]
MTGGLNHGSVTFDTLRSERDTDGWPLEEFLAPTNSRDSFSQRRDRDRGRVRQRLERDRPVQFDRVVAEVSTIGDLAAAVTV